VCLYAAKLIGLEPAKCVVVEDAAVGVEAGIAAGMYTVALGPVERFKAPNIVLPNLIGIHLSDLKFHSKMSQESVKGDL
jgi:beta-phosphoglucomutase-like phosphatase (HAD superfamily)